MSILTPTEQDILRRTAPRKPEYKKLHTHESIEEAVNDFLAKGGKINKVKITEHAEQASRVDIVI